MESNAELASQIYTCTNCPLHEYRTVAVPAEVGTLYEPGGIALIAEAPGANEDATGRPMVGRAGDVLNRCLEKAGLVRSELLIMNRVRCRPPRNNLKDFPEALEACDEWTIKEIEAYSPAVVVAMGRTALSVVFGAQSKVGETAGTLRATGAGFSYRVKDDSGVLIWVSTYHPAAALRRREVEAVIVEHLGLAREVWVGIV